MRRLNFSGLINNGRADMPIIGEGLEPESEKELADAAGRTAQERPYFVDEPPATKVVPISNIGKVKQDDD
jgi:hypothetical protein